MKQTEHWLGWAGGGGGGEVGGVEAMSQHTGMVLLCRGGMELQTRWNDRQGLEGVDGWGLGGVAIEEQADPASCADI